MEHGGGAMRGSRRLDKAGRTAKGAPTEEAEGVRCERTMKKWVHKGHSANKNDWERATKRRRSELREVAGRLIYDGGGSLPLELVTSESRLVEIAGDMERDDDDIAEALGIYEEWRYRTARAKRRKKSVRRAAIDRARAARGEAERSD